MRDGRFRCKCSAASRGTQNRARIRKLQSRVKAFGVFGPRPEDWSTPWKKRCKNREQEASNRQMCDTDIALSVTPDILPLGPKPILL